MSKNLAGDPVTGYGTIEKPFVISDPLILVFRAQDGSIVTRMRPNERDTYEGYGLLLADLVRHVAQMFGVEEADVREWVELELDRPETDSTLMQ